MNYNCELLRVEINWEGSTGHRTGPASSDLGLIVWLRTATKVYAKTLEFSSFKHMQSLFAYVYRNCDY